MSDDDPFEDMEDREGDPFEQFDRPDEDGDDSSTPATGDVDGSATDDDAPAFEEEFIEDEPFTVGGDDVAGSEADAASFETDPFGETDDTEGDPFRDMDGGDGDPFGGGDSAFEAVDVGELDEAELWAAIDGDGDTTTVEHKRYSEVSKHRFCEQCEFFAEPPASHCTHEEANILEYLDMEQVRVVNCPIVAEQQRIENEE